MSAIADFQALLPNSLDWPETLLMMLAASSGASITTVAGAGGGLLVLIALAQWLPPAALVPVHGMVQLGANLGRLGMTWDSVRWPVVLAFLPGALLGAWLASRILITLPDALWLGLIGGFVLILAWLPHVPGAVVGLPGVVIFAALSTFLSLFVGATGPLVAAFIRQMGEKRFATVATFAACMSIQHAPKAIAFGALGFVMRDWLGLIVLLMACTVVGNFIGVRLLKKLANKRFQLLLKVVLSLLAARLLWQAGVEILESSATA